MYTLHVTFITYIGLITIADSAFALTDNPMHLLWVHNLQCKWLQKRLECKSKGKKIFEMHQILQLPQKLNPNYVQLRQSHSFWFNSHSLFNNFFSWFSFIWSFKHLQDSFFTPSTCNESISSGINRFLY